MPSAGVELLGADARSAIRDRQGQGKIVAVVSDGAQAAAAFAASDLAIGLSRGHSALSRPSRFAGARLTAIADLLKTGHRQRRAMRDTVVAGVLATCTGLALSFRGPLGLGNALPAPYLAGLGALTAAWLRLRGGDCPRSALPSSPTAPDALGPADD